VAWHSSRSNALISGQPVLRFASRHNFFCKAVSGEILEKNPPVDPSTSSKAESIALIITACVIGALLIYLVHLRNYVFGSELGHWVYPYLSSLPFFPEWILLTVLFLVALLVFLGGKFIHLYEKTTLFFVFLIGVFIQSLIRKIYPYSLGAVVESDTANSFYSPAMSHSALEVLSKFDELVSSFPLHARSNMPGKILLFEFFKLFTSSSEAMGYLVIVVSSLGALLLYGICKRLFQDKRIAFYALTLYMVLPCKIFFYPILNTVTPVFMLLCFYLLVVYLDNPRNFLPWLLGASFFVLALFEPSPLITGIVMAGITLHTLREGKLTRRELVMLILFTASGFLAATLLFYLVFSFNFFQSFLYLLNEARNFNINDGRGYLIWIIENSREFFYGAGVPVMIIFIYMTVLIFARTKTIKEVTRWSLENVFVISLLVNFLVLLFLGINRGEITRLWIYLAVLFQVPASVFIAKTGKGTILFFLVASLLAMQGMVTLHRIGFVFP
jgi:hypothetical protein